IRRRRRRRCPTRGGRWRLRGATPLDARRPIFTTAISTSTFRTVGPAVPSHFCRWNAVCSMRRLLASFRLLRPLAHCADRPMDPACRRLVLALCSETVVAIRGTLRSTLLADEGRDGAGRLSAKDRAPLAQ